MRLLLMRANESTSVFHEGELAVQRRAGVDTQAAKIGGSIHSEMPAAVGAFLAERGWLVVATIDSEDRTRATAVWGPPGFAEALDAKTISLRPDARSRHDLESKLSADGRIGLVAIDLATRRRMRANGRVIARDANPLVVLVDEVFGNCKKYIQARVPGAADPAPPPIGRPARRHHLSSGDRACVEAADTFFIASRHADRGADASHRGGDPGFVRVIDAGQIAWPDYTGNRMFQTLGNLAVDPSASLLFIDFENGDLLELVGRAEIDWSPDRIAAMKGAERIVAFTIDAVVSSPGAFPWRKRLIERSPHNP